MSEGPSGRAQPQYGRPVRTTYTRFEQRAQCVAPGVILGRYLDILAWNPMATALFGTDFAEVPVRQ